MKQPKTPYTEARKGLNYILTIAIDDYQNNRDKLKNAKNDAIQLTNVLTSKYRFETKNVKEIFDVRATRENILEQLRSYISLLKEEDNLVIFYSGHASIDYETKKGYLLPYDKQANNWSSCIAYTQLTDMIKDIKKPRHIILFLNCCYAGSFFANSSKDRSLSTYLDDRFLKKSRYAFAAGERDQKALDESHQQEKISPFAEYIVRFLEENREDAVSIRTLAENVTKRVSENYLEQTPTDGVIQSVGHDGGEFSFQLKENEEEVWFKAFSQPNIENLTEACKRFPKNLDNAKKASIILDKLQEERKTWLSFLALAKQHLSELVENLDTKANHYEIANQTLSTLKGEYKKLTFKDEALRRFEEIKSEKNINAKIKLSEDFLEEFGNSKYYKAVQSDYNYYTRLKKQKEDWIKWNEIAEGTNVPERKLGMYKAFLKDYYYGEFVDKANDRIKDIEKYIKIKKIYNNDKIKSFSLLNDYDILYGTNGIFWYGVRKMKKEVKELKSKQKHEEILETLKKEKSIQQLQDFLEDDNYHQEIRIDAIQFLKNLKEEITLKFEKAKINNDIRLFYEIINSYKDYELINEVKDIFNKELKNAYEEAIQKVHEEKDTEPLKDYLRNYTTYKEIEAAQIQEANKKLSEFEYEKEGFIKLMSNDKVTELELKAYLENFPNSIWQEDVTKKLDELQRKTQGDDLYEKCIKEQLFKDLQKFVVEYKDSRHFTEIHPLYLNKRAENSFLKIQKLIKADKRGEAKEEVYDYIANNKEYEHYVEVLTLKRKLKRWDNEDKDFQQINENQSPKDRRQLCYNFLSNNDYLRHREKVEEILNPTSDKLGDVPLVVGNSLNNPVQKIVGYPKNEIRIIGGILIVLLITLIGILLTLIKN